MNALTQTPRILMSLVFCVLISSCTQAPPCPNSMSSQPAVSAGCLVMENHKLLVVQGRNGVVSIPGGSANPEEPGHCAAHRETWEETGLNVTPIELTRVFDNGFHLYRCRWQGEQKETEAPFFLEIDRAFWISEAEFDQFQWRFPKQAKWLLNILRTDNQDSTKYPAQD